MHRFWQILKKLKWLLSQQAETSPLKLSQGQSLPVAAKLLTRCEDVTMKQFIACICDNDLKQLVSEGEATAEQLAEAWAQLFLEYCDLAEHTEVRYKIRLQAETMLYAEKIKVAESCIEYLTVANNCRENIKNLKTAGFIDCLHNLGFEQELNFNDEKQFIKDLARISAELIPIKIRLKVKQEELASINNGTTSSDVVERKYFTTIFTRINNYAKREAVNMQTTVEMYCAALRDYVSALEANKVK